MLIWLCIADSLAQSMFVGTVTFNQKLEYIVVPPFRDHIKRSSVAHNASFGALCYLGLFVPDYDEDDVVAPPRFTPPRKRMGLSFIQAYNSSRAKGQPYIQFIEGFDIDNEGKCIREAMDWRQRRRYERELYGEAEPIMRSVP